MGPHHRDTRTVAVIGTRGYPSFYGGFETAVRRIAPALADRGWCVRVYGRRAEVALTRGDPRVESVLTPGLDTVALSTLSYGFTAVLHALVRKPDVALVMNVANGFWLPLLRLRGIPTVVNVDGVEWERDKWSTLGKRMFRWGARLTARFADQLVFDAEAIGDHWRHELGRDGTFVPYGGDPEPALPVEPGLEAGRYVVLIARLVPENTVAAFLAAAPAIVEQADVDVVVVGSAAADDPLQRTAEALAASHPRIHVLGHLSDDRRLHSLWQHAGVYFHGHTVGGTNPTLVQAMALGARIVARDTVYNREVLADTGVYCDGDAESIVRAVASALHDDRPMGERAAARAARHYSWARVVDEYAALLDTARRQPRRQPRGRGRQRASAA
ncbi:glycosyltransferase [Nocardioides sp.]|uniref:glycosyltransferase n=1 Tax=Nocardioides sp. TaxID=35761 RepID=UPI0025CC8B7F|nr:glycosyltransferase [Nocardioides sp.]